MSNFQKMQLGGIAAIIILLMILILTLQQQNKNLPNRYESQTFDFTQTENEAGTPIIELSPIPNATPPISPPARKHK